ncbi:LOW QUALITY PROTEIN: olfactory receptor 6C2-like [Xiphophorus maculatus]|uniref:LOW QUALITY PROTEIN: olfactory receptor 6C2-like n=1 Tax=Xiphophorus maculatus TaxID=8083 RepID=UPI000C6E0DF3|nr:LOW QUALITY PROTEIN: olfactory receptor 6C2-like [Xiphophorus maculatus]
MDLFNPALEENITFVRPAYFIIAGFIGIPNVNFYFVFLLCVYVLSVVGNGTVLTLIIMDHTLKGPKYVAVFVSVGFTTRLSFCKSVVINSYFCDHGPVYRLGCNDVSPSFALGILLTVIMLWIPLAFILATYCCIVYALSKISTAQERRKAFKTCTGHLSLVTIYFLPITLVFGIGSKMHPNARIINLSLTTIIPPMLNPIIYVFQTQEIKQALNKFIKKTRR